MLWSCLCGPENPSHLEARQRASSIPGLPEATTGLLLSAVPPSATLRSLLLALGSERSTALRVLTLMLHNAHIPAHRGDLHKQIRCQFRLFVIFNTQHMLQAINRVLQIQKALLIVFVIFYISYVQFRMYILRSESRHLLTD